MALKFETVTPKDLQVCNISTQQTREEMGTKVEAEMDVDVTEKANNRGISI